MKSLLLSLASLVDRLPILFASQIGDVLVHYVADIHCGLVDNFVRTEILFKLCLLLPVWYALALYQSLHV